MHRSIHSRSAGHCFYSLCTIVHINLCKSCSRTFHIISTTCLILGNVVFKNFFTVLQPLIHLYSHFHLERPRKQTPGSPVNTSTGVWRPGNLYACLSLRCSGCVCPRPRPRLPSSGHQPITEEKQIWSLRAALLQRDSPWLWPSRTSRLFGVVRSPAVKSQWLLGDRNTPVTLSSQLLPSHWSLCAHL